MDVRVRVDQADIDRQVDRETAGQLEATRRAVLADLQQETPKDTGEASEGYTATVVDVEKSTFSVSNSVEHINVLNAGHSDQAPARFIEGVVLRYGEPEGVVVDATRS
jgi:hypothetical protein